MNDGGPGADVARVAALIDLKRYGEARTMARQLLARDPGDVALLSLLVVASIELKDHRVALDDARRLVALAPDNARAHELLGVALHNRRRLRDAVIELERAVALDPNNPWYHVRLADFLIDHAKGGTVARPAPLRRRAAREADIARRLAPASPEPYLALARAGLAMRDEEGAAEAINRALELDPQNHRAHQLMGRTALAKGKFTKAGDHFMDAGRLQPQDTTNTTLLRLAGGGGVIKLGLLAAAMWVVLQVTSTGTDAQSLAQAAIGGVAFVLVALIASWVVTRRLSPEARAALERDRQLRRSRR